MVDLVGTCPQGFWEEWIAEGDAAGDPETGIEWGWYTRHPFKWKTKPGDRFYIVARGLLRGYSIVTDVRDGAIIRKGGAVACTVDEHIPGFQGLRFRWWDRSDEQPFPNWKTARWQAKQPINHVEPDLFAHS